ncbi:TonB-dependent receptor [Deminuibacter soli]|uniref:TonB-dependent receptor n=2 Tax=Deminuibacter soli TaxID=2291815 RepID=A0A3E1NH49_9BACT|nr:TonB-dependent receptor [Deminuibacter soli]
MPGGGAGRPRGGGGNFNVGHLYGKIVDSKTNKGIDAVSVQVIGTKFDTVTKKPKDAILGTVITQANGDFSFDNLPVFGKMRLRATAVGYTDYDAPVGFDIKRPDASSGQNPQDRMQQMMGMVDKDLGNIKINTSDANLGNVTVTATAKQFFEMGVDRKVFNVDKNLVSSGQTATEVMKQIPSVNVDIDGNVTLRNASPTLFVDGRPTTLTMDQIPADIIDRVELITNPSAKFDASSGGGGILNIVLKKNLKKGYNGGIRAGIDARGKYNAGADLNYRQGKFNIFLNGNYNQRKSKFTSTTDRQNLTTPPSTVHQELSNGVNNGEFAFLRGGFDFFADNRNTFTVAGSYVHGSFKNTQPSIVDSTIDNTFASTSNLNSLSKFQFRNVGGQLSYKHNFSKNGHDLTADVNYNKSTNDNNSSVATSIFNQDGSSKFPSRTQATQGDGHNSNLTIQTDYENPLTDNSKLEGGLRASIRNSTSNSYQFYDDTLNTLFSNRYKYTDAVYAAYGTYSFKANRFNFQLGMRAESSNYHGTLIDGASHGRDTAFKVTYPIALFPSTFITYKLNDKEDIQLNYSRKVNRPNFFQLLPSLNVSDPQNPSIGNPGLKPEFTNAFELSYNINYAHGGNFLATAFMRHSSDLITSYLYLGPNPVNPAGDSVTYSSYINANSSNTYGLELTNKLTLLKFWDLTLNVNLFNSKINTANIKGAGESNERFSWFGKMNNTFKLPHGFSIQFSGDYQAKTVLPASSGGGGNGGGGGGGGRGGGFGGGNLGAAQGYIKPHYGFDAAIKKDWTWKGGNSASVSLSMNDIFRTQVYNTYAQSDFLIQNQYRRRDPQLLRLNFSYRFGKFDASLFKRKSNKGGDSGLDMMGSGG